MTDWFFAVHSCKDNTINLEKKVIVLFELSLHLLFKETSTIGHHHQQVHAIHSLQEVPKELRVIVATYI